MADTTFEIREGYECFTFPHSVTKKGRYRMTMDILKLEHIPQIRQLFTDSEGGGAVGLDEGLIDVILQNPFGVKKNALQFTDTDTGEFLGAVFTYPSWMCRSNGPVMSAGYGMIAPAARGRHIARYGVHVRNASAWHDGYIGFLARTASNGVGSQMGYVVGEAVTGLIPKSVLTSEGRRLDDALVTTTFDQDPIAYQRRIEALDRERNVDPQGPEKGAAIPAWVHDDVTIPSTTFSLPSGERISIRAAQQADISHIDAYIRDAASKARGFAVDEFKDGYFNRRFLRKSHVITAATQDNTVVGAAIFGPTRLCRSKSTPILSAYIVVSPKYYRLGIGRRLLSAIEKYGKAGNFIGLLMDVFLSDTIAIDFVRSSGLLCIGTLPKCGYVKDHGFTDSLLWYKLILTPSKL